MSTTHKPATPLPWDFAVCDNLWFCQDCEIAECNADYSGMSSVRGAEVGAALDKLKAAGPLAPDSDSETGEGMESFSRRACDCCGSALAGYRGRFVQFGPNLQPCPCCGGEARFGLIRAGQQAGGHYIECKGCQLSTSLVFPLKDDVTRELAERWNKRAPVSETGPSVPVADLDIIGRREKGDENKGRAWWSGGTWLRPGEVVAVLTLPPEREGE